MCYTDIDNLLDEAIRRQPINKIYDGLWQTHWKGLKKFNVTAVDNICSPWKNLNRVEDLNSV